MDIWGAKWRGELLQSKENAVLWEILIYYYDNELQENKLTLESV